MQSYPDSVEYLYSLGNEVKSLKFGLEGITILLEALGNPHRSFQAVHVAGTNGKGSTSALIESALRCAGLRTGLYTSPHLVNPTERIRIDGVEITPDQFAGAFHRVHTAAEELMASGALEHHPTYFETATAMAFLAFRDASVDMAVLEVGMGGRLDATNVVTPRVSVITPVDFDHEQWLGNTIEKIAAEKAGILKSGVPCVISRQRPEALAVIETRAAEVGAPVHKAYDYTITDLELHPFGSRFRTGGRQIECPLAGEHQVLNATTAIAALDVLGVGAADIERGIAAARWPGRLERVAEGPNIVLDGAHNPAGARALSAYLRRFHKGRRVWMIYGAMRDKSIDEVAETLFAEAQEVILTAPRSSRAVDPSALLSSIDHPNARIAGNVAEALDYAKNHASPSDLVLVTGSLYLVGEARALFVQ